MSLINDMLRDLDRRGATPPTQVAETPPASRPGSSIRRWPWWLLLVVMAGGALIHLSQNDSNPTLRGAEPAATAPEPIEIAAFTLTQTADSQTPAEPRSHATPEPAATEAITPVVHDAPSEPDTTGSDAEHPAVPEPGAAQDREPPAAANPGTVSAPTAPTTLTEPERSPVSAPERSAPTTPTRPPAPMAIAQRTTASSDDLPRISAAESAESVIRIERANPVADDREQTLLSARRALARGQHDQARQLLARHLARKPDDHPARILLARVLVENGRASAARQTLEDGLATSNASPVAAELGRLLLTQNQTEAALRVLNDHAPPIAADPDYHLLLAATLRQAGRHQQALASYQALSRLVPEQQTVWIGLGSTLETLARPDEARAAYQQALDGSNPRAVAFARGRLNALAAAPEPTR